MRRQSSFQETIRTQADPWRDRILGIIVQIVLVIERFEQGFEEKLRIFRGGGTAEGWLIGDRRWTE